MVSIVYNIGLRLVTSTLKESTELTTEQTQSCATDAQCLYTIHTHVHSVAYISCEDVLQFKQENKQA